MCYVVFVSVNLANFEDLAGPEDLVDPGNLEDLEDSKIPLFPGRAPKALSVDEEEPAGGEEDAFLQARDNDDTSGICKFRKFFTYADNSDAYAQLAVFYANISGYMRIISAYATV